MLKFIGGSILLTIGSLVLVAALVAGGIAASIYIPRLIAGPTGTTEEIVTTTRGAYRIPAYEKFYKWEEEFEQRQALLTVYQGPLDKRQQQECFGLVARITTIVADYNAASRAERTTGKWRADDLPETLEYEVQRNCAEGVTTDEEVD